MARKLNNDRALRIAAAAKQEFAKRGFAGARVDRIARAAGVNKQLLFYYFQSKRGLFQAAVRRAMAELEAALGSSAQLSGRPTSSWSCTPTSSRCWPTPSGPMALR